MPCTCLRSCRLAGRNSAAADPASTTGEAPASFCVLPHDRNIPYDKSIASHRAQGVGRKARAMRLGKRRKSRNNDAIRENAMRRILMSMMFVALPALAAAEQDLVLRGMGSFHIGGRLVEISGQPIREGMFTPGGVPAKVDPNGTYQAEQI